MGSKLTIARLSIENECFEIIVRPDAALDFKQGKLAELSQILIMDTIFSDANKGMRASEEELRRIFKTTDPHKVAEIILKKGQLQLTTEQRHKLLEEKKKQVVSFISRRCIDPRTGSPHPPLRIEQAMEQIHITINPFDSVEEQTRRIIEELRPILPIRIEQIRTAIRIPPEYASQSIGVVKEFGIIKEQEWQVDGSWVVVIEVPAGLHAPLLEKLGRITRGSFQTMTLK